MQFGPGTIALVTTTYENKKLLKEITSSTATEETHTKGYQIALEELHKKISTDKHMRLLQKERAKEQILLHKDKSSMTLMEKLQLEATTEEVHKKTETSKKRRFLGFKKNPTKNKEKKLKATKAKKGA